MNRMTATARTTPITRQAAATPTMSPSPVFPLGGGVLGAGGALGMGSARTGRIELSPRVVETIGFSAPANSPADLYRSSGFFKRALEMTSPSPTGKALPGTRSDNAMGRAV